MLDDQAFAAELAQAAGDLLLELRDRPLAGRQLGAEGDRRSNELLLDRLRQLRPSDAVLSEESVDDPSRLSAHRVWIIDPLDGTREYGEAGRDDWAVHVALWENDRLVAGAVCLPARRLLLRADRVPMLDRTRESRVRLLVSRSRPPAIVDQVSAELGAEVVPMGSAGAKAAAVVLGEAEAYIHAGGQYEWDSAAPAAVALGAGLHVSRLDGSPLRYNQSPPYLPDLVICRSDLAEKILSSVTDSAPRLPRR